MKIISQSVKILSPTSREEAVQSLKLVEYAGRNCYRSHDKITDDSYVRFNANLMERSHHSPLEFAHVTFEIVTSRDVMAEITRHRIGVAFAIRSQRYVLDDKEGEISFIKPDFYIEPDENLMDAKGWVASRCWEGAMWDAEDRYRYLIETCGCPPQDARKVLPNSTATIIVMQCNLRELLHIIELRNSPRAYPEMQTMMKLLVAEVEKLFPEILPKKEA